MPLRCNRLANMWPSGSSWCTLLTLLVLVTCAAELVTGRICKSVRVSNNLSFIDQQLRNCTVVVEDVQLVLLNRTTERDFANVSFPELREIWQRLIVVNVGGLTSLGKLFPNLEVVRGYEVFGQYALIIFNAPNLKEIGLKNLRMVQRGGVRIEKCPMLCYAETVHWSKLNTSLYYQKSDRESLRLPACPMCSDECSGNGCWSQNSCQITTPIPTRLVENSTCYDCKENETCLNPGNRCIPRELCSKLSTTKSTFFEFDGYCRKNCPKLYQLTANHSGCEYYGKSGKTCDGDTIFSLQSLQSFSDCNLIRGNLSLRVSDEAMVPELERHLGNVVEIEGYLKISRSNVLRSLGFFRKLQVIKGVSQLNNNSLIVQNNPNLKELWEWTNLSIKSGSISFHDNEQLCFEDIQKAARNASINFTFLDVSQYSNGDGRACGKTTLVVTVRDINSTSTVIECSPNNNLTTDYYVYYRPVEMDESRISDICEKDDWDTIFDKSSLIILTNLIPFTEYMFYIKTGSVNTNDFEGEQSEVKKFKTLSGDPDAPTDIQAISYRHDSIDLNWTAPVELRGNLSHYQIIYYPERDNATAIDVRDYCKAPRDKFMTKEEWYVSAKDDDDCNCEKRKLRKLCRTYSEERYETELSCNSIFDHNFVRHSKFKKRGGAVESLVKEQRVSAKSHNYTFMNLEHYTTYIFLISACNENNANSSNSQCSEIVMVYNRTVPNSRADDITDLNINKVDESMVEFRWAEPRNPNSIIVAYEIEFNHQQDSYAAGSKWQSSCLTRLKHVNSRSVFNRTFDPGYYVVRVRAISLAGPGKFSNDMPFSIKSDNRIAIVLSVILTLLLILIVVCTVIFLRFKQKRRHEHLHLITDVNPDYKAEYVEDHWEVQRSAVEVLDDLGHGTFGMVRSGYVMLDGTKRECAIKTVNETATMADRIAFLNEASVMKAFNEAHHVVRLYGVVSRGQPPLVLMELMGCGDLKNFLRKARKPSQSITYNEMYRMAAEIADGMTYLTAKKFVHRDLAARNCMVSIDHTIKIGDFGMARDIYETDYYRKGSRGLMPVRWMAPESLSDGVFTSDSDVWSYGVVLWEMVTLAEQPYQGLANEQVWEYVVTHGTLVRPQECPDTFFEIMQACWMWEPNARPMFIDIVKKLENYIGQDFKFFSFYHSQKGVEYQLNLKERPYNPPALTIPRESEDFVHFHASDDNLSLHPTQRKTTTFSFPHQRKNRLSECNLEADPLRHTSPH